MVTEAVLWFRQTQTFQLKMAPFVFCLAPVYHISVLRLRREKLHELSPKTKQKKKQQKKSLRSEKSSQNVTQNAASLDLVSLIFCLFQPIARFCLAAKLTLISVCYLCKLVENPVEKHSKALRKPDYITTSLSETICRLAYSGGLMHLHP